MKLKEKTGAYVSFVSKKGEQRLMKVAISYVSAEEARLNLETELPHWNFDQTVAEARGDWNQWLSRIEIEGGTEEEQRRFYTDLWHALQGRRIISDASGQYCDMTGAERQSGKFLWLKMANPNLTTITPIVFGALSGH